MCTSSSDIFNGMLVLYVNELKSGQGTKTFYAPCISYGWGTNIRTCKPRGSREDSACYSIRCYSVCYSSHYESYTAVSKVYLHVRKCNCTCTSFYAHLFASARSSPKRRLTGYIVRYVRNVMILIVCQGLCETKIVANARFSSAKQSWPLDKSFCFF